MNLNEDINTDRVVLKTLKLGLLHFNSTEQRKNYPKSNWTVMI